MAVVSSSPRRKRWTLDSALAHSRTQTALRSIRGIGAFLAGVIIRLNDLPLKTVDFSADHRAKFVSVCERVIGEDTIEGTPRWTFNDRRLGRHFTNTRLRIRQNGAISYLKALRNYRGLCHTRRTKVRGQSTRSTGRKNKKTRVVKRVSS